MPSGTILSKSQCPSTQAERDKMSGIPYASAIGSIMYAMICTRPDVSYALSMTSRYQQDPGEGHWIAVKNILKDDCKSQSGFVFIMNGGAVSWMSSKQSVVAQSTTESEYIAASEAAKEAAWIKKRGPGTFTEN
ncbi:hypothetical protein L6452_39102 [Arctium lappa]|uniref:Uncharacterized protein n=1 Tax=Arctium lappa TaxID=4217 RepID=A0ACB8XRE7_ARCLA|nr:hypothetical protein L6452_39102 [Arctium lappa]